MLEKEETRTTLSLMRRVKKFSKEWPQIGNQTAACQRSLIFTPWSSIKDTLPVKIKLFCTFRFVQSNAISALYSKRICSDFAMEPLSFGPGVCSHPAFPCIYSCIPLILLIVRQLLLDHSDVIFDQISLVMSGM